MRKPKIFVASSSRALPLARHLEGQLNTSTVNVELWENPDVFEAGGTTFTSLAQACGKCDFAAVLLTPDDSVVKNGTKYKGPRDNCIFELGLFLGHLGLDLHRVFLLSAIKKEGIPTDISGVTYIPILDVDRGTAALEAIEKAAATIRARIRDMSLYYHPVLAPLNQDELIGLEREGVDDVIVSSAQPLETYKTVAQVVFENLKKKVEYSYFFHADTGGVKFIAGLLASLADAHGGLKAAEEPFREQLQIHFLAQEQPIEFCIHNPSRNDTAKCYLRHGADKFYLWCQGKPARNVADDLKKLTVNKQNRIFQSTTVYDLDAPRNKNFVGLLRGALRGRFSDKSKLIEQLCFGPK